MNDNEKFSFISLAALTANVVRHLKLGEEKQEESTDDAKRRDADEQKRKEHKAYVDQGLRNIRAFERRARGNKN